MSPSLRSWAKSVQHVAQGFDTTPLTLISGRIPSDLRGTLYRNGPGRLERGGRRLDHWFDGDGAVLGVKFRDAGATATYKYVQTAGYQAEEKADRYLYAGYGSHGSSAWLGRWRGLKNAANTSVLTTTDKLLALWEGGMPHEMDLETLETIGPTPLAAPDGLKLDGLKLTDKTPFSAHPKVDPQTREIFNFGVSFGPKTSLHLYRSNPQGTIVQTRAHEIQAPTLLHDFAIVGPYLIFCLPPLRLDLLPLMAHLKTFSDALMWKPELGTEILIFDRNTLDLVNRFTTEPWFQWHFGNGEVRSDGTVLLELVRYEDFATNTMLRDIPTGQFQPIAPSQLVQLQINPTANPTVQSPLLGWDILWNQSCEFPTVNPQVVGQSWRYSYFSTDRPNAKPGELYEAFGRFDRQTGQVTIADCGPEHYVSETLYAPKPNEQPGSSDRGWLISTVFNAQDDRSEVWIHEAESQLTEPICRIALPEIIPLGFHGTWRSV